ncbi:MAG: 2-hydroxy-6-oxononadienedioate/2-hydroxy-6-oxononatrienedioate hydrolase [bacterium]|nr:2-hydroxy-6-oxononadienedioate/2-hydroxy-6-oxononatrienedioate hydrolase [bacterium]
MWKSLTLALLFAVGCAHQAPTSNATLASQVAPWTDSAPHRSGFITVNGIRLHYLDWGGNGDVIMLLAGLGNTAHVFDDFAPRLTAHFRVYALTRRGYGESDHPKSGYDTATLVEDLRGALDSLRIARVHLVGHSLVGDELSGFAARYPDRVGKLVYLDAAYDRAELKRLLTLSLFTNPKPPAPPKPGRRDRETVMAYSQYLERIYGVLWPEAEVRATKRFDTNGRYMGEVANSATALKILQGEEHPAYDKITTSALALYALQKSVEQAYPWPFGSPIARLNAWNWYTGRWKPFAKGQQERFEKEVGRGRVAQIHGNHYLFLSHADEIIAQIKSFLREP